MIPDRSGPHSKFQIQHSTFKIQHSTFKNEYTKKFSELPLASDIGSGKLLVVDNTGVKRATIDTLRSALKIGGRNLLKASNVEMSSNSGQLIGRYPYAELHNPEYDDVTLTVCYTLNGPGFRAYFTDYNTYGDAAFLFTENGTRLVRTVHFKPVKHDDTVYYNMAFYKGGNDYNFHAAVHWAVLTRGVNLGVSDWTPAPEDFLSGG